MNLRRVVGGLMARDAVVARLLMNYADRLVRERPGHPAPPGPCFLVPMWDSDERPSPPPASQLFAVEAHTRRDDPCPHDSLDILLALLHSVLTDAVARWSITARFDGATENLTVSSLGTVYKVGTWQIAPAPPWDPGTPGAGTSGARPAQPRLLPWPDRPMTATGLAGVGAASMN
jgi:hypothetical protein